MHHNVVYDRNDIFKKLRNENEIKFYGTQSVSHGCSMQRKCTGTTCRQNENSNGRRSTYVSN
ncbi:hypothetical protein BN1088_1431551 [Sphingobacterium sp. PM2-P1-29]|nr:hypothetical protein BN1088_1431551 [Sphingobacterium sp. PM2-P1-29]